MRRKLNLRFLSGLVALFSVLLVSLAPFTFASCSTSSVEENEPTSVASPTPTATPTDSPTQTATPIPEPSTTGTPVAPQPRTISTLVDNAEVGSSSLVVGGASEYFVGSRFVLNYGKESQEELHLIEVKFERRTNRGVNVLSLESPLTHSHTSGESVSEIPPLNPEPTRTPYPYQVPSVNSPVSQTPSVPQIPSNVTFQFDLLTPQIDQDAIRLGVERASLLYESVLGRTARPMTFVTVTSGCKGVVATNIAPDIICVNVLHPDWTNRIFAQKFKTGAHEYFHNVQRTIGCQVGWDSPGQDAVWLGEGSAEFYAYWVLSESGLTPLYETLEQLKLPLRANESLRISEMESSSIQGFSYALSAVAVDFLVSKSTITSYVTYCELRSSGVQWKSAFETAFGLTLSEFYEQFELYRANGYR